MVGTRPNGLFILLCEQLSREQAAISLWHEFRHIMESSKPNPNQDEDVIEADAKRLAAAFPEIIEWCGLGDKFPIPVDKI